MKRVPDWAIRLGLHFQALRPAQGSAGGWLALLFRGGGLLAYPPGPEG